ncbi:DUF4920 domain-containing protein [Yeosuana sp. MJ-SS3]|uniref:DUF4920 domain-containing protein n=1 Tax=Gilvirhabdus luticola TaxID=3079858 RepID=A0ABU3U6Q3_9FLAO|nr:DUF4920 domain-containing protein [Yeosuana sp. MJ-SS3]MDU8886071.1 DUF4920 domain-containing protein [Yeosuana sp. MJ-SS3]
MKKVFSFIIVLVVISSCRAQNDSYASFGEKISADNAVDIITASEKYQSMKTGDTTDYKLTATVNEVCQAKGCWMTLNLEDGNEIMVKFKDYGFFVPKDIAGKEVVIQGKAFVNIVPVKELRHYAEDAGKSKEEIAQITKPKKTYSFEAEGVLLKQ